MSDYIVSGEGYKEFIVASDNGLIQPGDIIFTEHKTHNQFKPAITTRVPYKVIDIATLRPFMLVELTHPEHGLQYQKRKTDTFDYKARKILQGTPWEKTTYEEATKSHKPLNQP